MLIPQQFGIIWTEKRTEHSQSSWLDGLIHQQKTWSQCIKVDYSAHSQYHWLHTTQHTETSVEEKKRLTLLHKARVAMCQGWCPLHSWLCWLQLCLHILLLTLRVMAIVAIQPHNFPRHKDSLHNHHLNPNSSEQNANCSEKHLRWSRCRPEPEWCLWCWESF